MPTPLTKPQTKAQTKPQISTLSKTTTDTFIAPVCHDDIGIVFEDEHLLVINKPSGLLSLSGKNPLNKDSVHYRIVQQYPTATMAHRIDFGTSGVMVLALNKTVNGHLTRQFQERRIEKTYTAVLRGHLADEEGSIDIPIIKDADHFPYQKICYTTGKKALSHYRVVERLGVDANLPLPIQPQTQPQIQPQSTAPHACATRVIFTPHTGRTHQLRIHSQAIGHPILGCDLYGNNDGGVDSVSMAPRLLLHATTLSVEHPVSGEALTFTVPCPF